MQDISIDTDGSPDNFGLVYGTAWKTHRTRTLVLEALDAGFRAFDTAAQAKHYQESDVGQAIREALTYGQIKRSDLTIQTKFTWGSAQEPGTEPYDVNAPIQEQVRQSLRQSLSNLRHTETPFVPEEFDDINQAPQDAIQSIPYIDCLLLHFPPPTLDMLLQAWTAMETFVPRYVRRLGISNATLPVLQVLFRAKSVTVRPSLVQNTFHAAFGHDAELRVFCAAHRVEYQYYGVLGSQHELLKSDAVRELAADVDDGMGPETALYFLVLGLKPGKVTVLNGTKNSARMKNDIEGIKKLSAWAGRLENAEKLMTYRRTFQHSLQQTVP